MAFRKRLDSFQLTDTIIQAGLDRIKRAFERGETELMISSFPSNFCTEAVGQLSTPARPRSTSQARRNAPHSPTSLSGWRRCPQAFIRSMITGGTT